jgi:hypothetical protein
MELKEYSYEYGSLNVQFGTIEKLMGYEPGESPDPIPELIAEALERAPEYCDIRGGYVIREDIALDKENQVLNVDHVAFDVHRVITRQLRQAQELAVFVCTAGPGISEWSKELMHEGDMIKGYVVDVIGSEVVEVAMDHIQDILGEDMQKEGKGITDRYSPGYCDWPVSEQHKLFSFFPKGFCGITLSPSSLMHPIKSVSGVIGIGSHAKRKGYPCDYCNMVNCIYRRKRDETKKADRC